MLIYLTEPLHCNMSTTSTLQSKQMLASKELLKSFHLKAHILTSQLNIGLDLKENANNAFTVAERVYSLDIVTLYI